LQRGGSPSSEDRLLALRMGTAAVQCLAETNQSGVIAMVGNHIQLIPFDQVVGGIRSVEPHEDLLRTGRSLHICFGDEVHGAFNSLRPGLEG